MKRGPVGERRIITDRHVESLRMQIVSFGWTIVQSSVERSTGDVLEESAKLLGAPLVVVGVPTEDERKIIYPPDGVARFPAAFEYKVTTD